MLAHISIDLSTVAVLAFVVWLDGWRRMSADALLVARTGVGPWTVRTPWTRAGGFALVAWWEPFVLPIVISPPRTSEPGPLAPWTHDFHVATARAARRLRRVRPNLAFLRGLGVLLVIWIVIGIPLATERFGGLGLIYGVLGAFGLAAEITMIATFSMQMLGVRLGRSLRTTAQLLSPFGAPRAAGIVAAEAVGSRHPLASIAALLGEASFLGWIRPFAYDTLAERRDETTAEADAMGELVRALPSRVLERAVTPVDHNDSGAGIRFCPRCTRTYRESVVTCNDCDGLPLVTVSSPAP